MVQNDIHRPHVLPLLAVMGKTEDTLRSCLVQPLSVIVQGCGRKLFFACSGNGNGTSWNNRGSNGNYRSASFNSARNAYNLNFNSGGVNPQNNNNRYNGFAVRPVQHTLLTILLLFFGCYNTATYGTNYGTDKAAVTSRPLSGILQCEETQIGSGLCEEMGKESQAEHGRAVRRFVLSEIQARPVEVLHCGLSQEEGDIRCNIQGPYRTSSLFQLHAWPVREDVYTGHVQLHQGAWHSLWHWSCERLLQEGESQLAAEMLCDALGYSRLLHAHQTKEAIRGSYRQSEEDGQSSVMQGKQADVERRAGYGFRDMADGNHRHAESERELYHLWQAVRLGWSGPCQVDASLGRWPWPAHRQPNESTLLECLSECVRPVYEARTEMQVLWQVCGRCSRHLCRQGETTELGAENKGFLESGAGSGITHGQAGTERGTSWRGVLRSLYQALANVHIESCFRPYQDKDSRVRLLEALESATFGKLLLRNIPTHEIVQSEQETADDETDSTHRHLRQGYDQNNRQTFIL